MMVRRNLDTTLPERTLQACASERFWQATVTVKYYAVVEEIGSLDLSMLTAFTSGTLSPASDGGT